MKLLVDKCVRKINFRTVLDLVFRLNQDSYPILPIWIQSKSPNLGPTLRTKKKSSGELESGKCLGGIEPALPRDADTVVTLQQIKPQNIYLKILSKLLYENIQIKFFRFFCIYVLVHLIYNNIQKQLPLGIKWKFLALLVLV